VNALVTGLRRLQDIPKLGGWRRVLVALGFGALCAFAFAPVRAPMALVVALSGLALLLEGIIGQRKSLWASFITGSAFGAAYFSSTMAWLANAFLVQADAFAWLIPIVLPAFFLFLGLFFGMASVIHVAIRERVSLEGLSVVLPLVLGLMVTEWLRGHILSGLPWNLFSQSMAGNILALQPLAILGPYGYGLVIVGLSLLPAALLLQPGRGKLAAAITFPTVIVLMGLGMAKLSANPTELRDDVSIVIVQPNLGQRDKLDPAKRNMALVASLEATAEAARQIENRAVYAVWPENAYPFLGRIPELGDYLNLNTPPETYLVSGSIRSVGEGYANTLLTFGPARDRAPLLSAYDKHRLVPFGETLPFYEVFEALGLASLAPTGGAGFVPGEGPQTFSFGPAPFAPLICYEDVFPGTLFPRKERPDWMVLVTNDAWFGDADGPEQHLDIARMRAVETGLPLARSANTGISALIDPQGRVLQALPLYQKGVITTALPKPGSKTLFSRSGDLIFFVMLSFIGTIVLVRKLQHRIAISNLNATK